MYTRRSASPRDLRPEAPADYARIRRLGVIHRDGPWCVHILKPSPDGKLRLVMRLGRKVGSAPLRNRLRRQVRALVTDPAFLPVAVWMLWTIPARRITEPTATMRVHAINILRRLGSLP